MLRTGAISGIGNMGRDGLGGKNAKSRPRLRVPAFAANHRAQYRRWRLVTSREARRAWRFTAAAALRLRSWVGFS